MSLVTDCLGADAVAQVDGCVAKRGADKFDHSQLFCDYEIKENTVTVVNISRRFTGNGKWTGV